MSYIYNNSIKYSDSSNLDAFGRLRVSEITSLIEITHVYDKQPLLISEVTGGTATSDWDQVNSQVLMSAFTSGDFVVRQSKNSAVYQPGKGQLFEASFSSFQLETDVIKRVGYFTSTTASTYDYDFDGFFLESNGVSNEISFQIWKSGINTFSSATPNWNSNIINVSSIDWSKTNLMLVDFQWLGVGRVRFGLSLSGNTYIFTENSGTNNLNNVYMSSPNKPIRYEISSSGGTGSFNQICSQVSMEGSLNNLYIPVSIMKPSSTNLATNGVKYAIIGIKMANNYESLSPIVRSVNVLNTSNDNYEVTLEINPTISGSYSFSSNTQNAVLKSFGNGSQTITTDGLIIGGFIGESGTQALSSFVFEDSKIKVGKTVDGILDELWICIRPLGDNATFFTSTNLYYYI